jgi:hypothetical protein
MVKHDQMKLSAASRNGLGNLSDSPEETELLQEIQDKRPTIPAIDEGFS